MSYDLRIYFPQEEFPRAAWDSILLLFDAEAKESLSQFPPFNVEWWIKAESRTAFEPILSKAHSEVDPVTGLITWVHTYYLWITLSSLSPKTWGYCTPEGSHWRIQIEVGSGASDKADWMQFAIPYYALGFIEGLTVHDCQWHDDENMYSFQDAEEWAKFASRALASRGWLSWKDISMKDISVDHERKDEWVRQGLITEEGRVLF